MVVASQAFIRPMGMDISELMHSMDEVELVVETALAAPEVALPAAAAAATEEEAVVELVVNVVAVAMATVVPAAVACTLQGTPCELTTW